MVIVGQLIVIWSLFLLVNGAALVDTEHDSIYPRGGTQFSLPGNPAPISDPDSIKEDFTKTVFEEILQDQLQVTPEPEKNYIFLVHVRGNAIQNVCNGGAQYVVSISFL